MSESRRVRDRTGGFSASSHKNSMNKFCEQILLELFIKFAKAEVERFIIRINPKINK